MPPPVFTASDYAIQFQRLLPRGRVWHRGLGMIEDADILVLMPQWARLNERLGALINEIFPCTTEELVPEWEATLGLPDECMGMLDTLQQRQAAICAKFKSLVNGGQSIAYFKELAASLGIEGVEINTFAPFRVGMNTVGQPLNGPAWAFAWQVVIPETTTIGYFRVGISTVGEPLRWWGDKVLECLIRAFAPAHTILFFSYTSASR